MLYRTTDDLDFDFDDLQFVEPPSKVLMTTPDHFQVRYVINPHMRGNIGDVNTDAAREQWDSLRAVYEAIGIEVSVIEGTRGLPDMVFCANQTLPYRTPGGTDGIVASRMHAPERRDEVAHFVQFFTSLGYERTILPGKASAFEGCGDAIWHPSRYLLYGGYGFRTDEAAYAHISDKLDVPILLIGLDDPDFYHLDTCLCMLDPSTCMIYPGAFDDDGLDLIDFAFETVIEVPESEARNCFAVNAHCPDERHVIIPEGCDETVDKLSEYGFLAIEVDTSEFIKSGGSVFCMKQMYW